MTKTKTTEYIDIRDIPPKRGPYAPWIPWRELDAIPPGKALELTHLLNGRKCHCAHSTVSMGLRRTGRLGLRSLMRGGRLFVVREEEADA